MRLCKSYLICGPLVHLSSKSILNSQILKYAIDFGNPLSNVFNVFCQLFGLPPSQFLGSRPTSKTQAHIT